VRSLRSLPAVTRMALAGAALAAFVSCTRTAPSSRARTFAAPEDAVRALVDAAKADKPDDVRAIFGPEGRELVDSSDPATARRNREVFTVAVAERWQLVDQGQSKVLVIGNEAWPFPIPLVKDAGGWRFDAAAGKDEVLARRIGRNELAVIRIGHTYVAAQHLYARNGHDGQPAGLYARAFKSEPGRQNGLYWPTARGEKRSPLGDLVADAAEEGRRLGQDGAPAPFHGYYFRILTAQGPAAAGGAKDYVVDGRMSGGFALVAWPAQYDVTGIMTFIVNHDGIVREKDLGPDTAATAKAITLYDPDPTWTTVQ
jgi:Protein of unknown function (DUF2950)